VSWLSRGLSEVSQLFIELVERDFELRSVAGIARCFDSAENQRARKEQRLFAFALFSFFSRYLPAGAKLSFGLSRANLIFD